MSQLPGQHETAFPAQVSTDYGPAVPVMGPNGIIFAAIDSGLSKREYVCLQLMLPQSGTEWIDNMIRERNKLNKTMELMKISWDTCGCDPKNSSYNAYYQRCSEKAIELNKHEDI